MKPYRFYQFGTFLIGFLGVFTLLFALVIFVIEPLPAVRILLPGIVLLMIFIGLLFYRMIITVDEKYVAFSLGIGLIGKKYPMSSISSCTPVTNDFWMGVGIHWVGKGWLYNVSGMKAVELAFTDRKGTVRLGTAQPEKVCEAIAWVKANRGNSPDPETTQKLVQYERNTGWVRPVLSLLLPLAIAAFIFGGLFRVSSQETNAVVSGDQFVIESHHPVNIPLSSITGVDTLQVMPAIHRRTNGYSFAGTLIGNFRLKDNSKAVLYLHKKIKPVLKIQSECRPDTYVNFKDPAKTRELFRQLTD